MDQGLADKTHELELVIHLFQKPDVLKEPKRVIKPALVVEQHGLIVAVHGVLFGLLKAVNTVKSVGDVIGLPGEGVVRM